MSIEEFSSPEGKYCLVCMSYAPERECFYERVKRLVQETGRLACKRLDKAYSTVGPPVHIQQEIHDAIDGASLVIMDLAGLRPDVLYEIGYSFARNKDLVILAPKEREFEIPSILHGLRLIEYHEDNEEKLVDFEGVLGRFLANSYAARYMKRVVTLPKQPGPTLILANPRPPEPETGTIKQQFGKPYGDYIGIVGLMKVFGCEFGDSADICVESTEWDANTIYEKDFNVYLIGSPRSNKLTEFFLDKVQNNKTVKWKFQEYVYGYDERKQEQTFTELVCNSPVWKFESGQWKSRYPTHPFHDYGLIVRVPHPQQQNRVVVIIAGAHSLGTGAACVAATRTDLLEKIEDKMEKGHEADYQKNGMWVLVKGTVETSERWYSQPQDVDIVEVKPYSRA